MLINTERFVLRDFILADRTPFVGYQMDPQYLRLYDLDETHRSKADELFATFLRWQQETPRKNFQLGIFDRSSRLCGSIGLRRRSSDNEAVFGIELSPADWGRYGLALEVASAMIDFGFGELGLDRVVGDTASGNRRITRFAQFFGAQIVDSREGPQWMKARDWIEVDWALTRSRWLSARAGLCRRESARSTFRQIGLSGAPEVERLSIENQRQSRPVRSTASTRKKPSQVKRGLR